MNNEQLRTNKGSQPMNEPAPPISNTSRQTEEGSPSQQRSPSLYGNRDSMASGFGGEGLYLGIGAALIGIGTGLATMYFLDPDRGGRRRGLLTDQIASSARRFPRAVRVTVVDLSNRAQGAWAEAIKMFSTDNPADQVVEARVKSKLGRVCSHPHAIHVTSRGGNVTLDGVVLAQEVPELLKCVMGVRGVKSVDNRLREFNSPVGISSLQGGAHREYRTEFMQQNLSPAARFTAGTIGVSALTYALVKRDLISLGFGAAGAALLARSLSNTELSRFAGITGGRAAITVEKSINVNAPVDVLWSLWSNFENFPQFMSNVLEVRSINDSLSRWKVAGPAGTPVEWDAEVTKVIPNEMIAWKSIEGSMVPNAGYVLFEPNDDGTTEVTVRISYNPPAGAIGHAIAKVFGADPKAEMDTDLMRMKTLLETGQAPHDAAQNVFESPRGHQLH